MDDLTPNEPPRFLGAGRVQGFRRDPISTMKGWTNDNLVLLTAYGEAKVERYSHWARGGEVVDRCGIHAARMYAVVVFAIDGRWYAGVAEAGQNGIGDDRLAIYGVYPDADTAEQEALARIR